MREKSTVEAASRQQIGANSGGADDVRLSRAAALGLQTLIALSVSGLTIDLASGGELPIPCGAGTCGPTGPTAWITAGNASATATASSLTIDQSSDRLVLNWQQFNIGSDSEVKFRQPDATSVALNKIFQGDPVRILGTLQANGSVYLINQNGILFGPSARVNVGGLIASTLDLTPDAVTGLLDAAKKSAPAFRAFVDDAGQSVSADVRVEAGAKLTADGGQLFLFGSNVTNAGTLEAAGGQVILAAGDAVYLAPSQDPNLRGLLVEVGRGGAATNASTGVASAPRGNVTLVGLMVNQEGRASATTSVRENGSVRLLARDDGQIIPSVGTKANNGGTLRLAGGSTTAVELEHNDDDKAVDVTPQARSFVELEGETVSLESQSQVIAPSGLVQITAREDGTQVADFAAQPGQGRVVMAPDATVDVAGAQIERSVDSNIVRVELRGSQLADSPEQRDGPLRGQTVYVDIRRSGTRADGTSWVGSPIGDLAGDIATIQKTVEERSLLGGQVQIAATGAVLLESGSLVNVSGGGIDFLGGLVKTSQVLGADGRIYDIGNADRDRQYLGLTNSLTVEHKKWGVSEQFQTFWPSQGVYESGYHEGKDAGSVSITAPRAALDGAIRGEAVAGLHQRTPPSAVPAGALYRSVAELPLAGRLTLGTAVATGTGGFLIPGALIAPGDVLGELKGPTGASFDPLLDPLPDELATVRVRPELFGAHGLGALTVYANGIVTLDASSALDLSNAGQLSFTAGVVDIQGHVVAPSGSVSFNAQPTITVTPVDARLELGRSAAIDVAGRWINDAPDPRGAAQHDPLALNGGSVAISAKGGAELELLVGSRIDVSGGANRRSDGTIVAGRGGSLSISAAPRPGGKPAAVTLESEMFANAFRDGGRLSLTLSAFCLSDADCSGDAATGTYLDDLGVSPLDGLHVDLATFTLDGFEAVSLTSNLGGIDVAPGTHLQLRQHNYLWALEPSRVQSGTPLSSMTTIGLAPDPGRQPFNLSLTARPQVGDGGPILSADFAQLGFLSIGSDAALDLDVGASLTLQSSSTIVVDGSLSAPAGSIVVDVTRDLQLQEFVPNQGAWLGDRARLVVAGAVEALPDDLGFLRGSVLDGGSISVRAERGYVFTGQQSVLDASGTAADLVVGQTPAGSSAQPTRVASSGGSIEIAAAEGLLLNGAMNAPAGAGSTARGGSLRVTLDGNLHGVASSPTPIFPWAPRDLHLVSGEAPIVIPPGQALPADFYGRGVLPVERVAGGGFTSVELDAKNLFDALSNTGTPVSTGSIQFDGSMTLNVDGTLRLDTPRLASAPGSGVTLSAAYVGLGYDDIAQNAQTGGSASPGASSLTVNGRLIDLIGTLVVDGFGTTKLASSGDIRLRGVEPTSGDGSALPIAGLLHSQGLVDFSAQQVYATTLTDYQVLLDGPGHEVLTLHSSPGTPGAVLSAGGRITLSADEISQGGVLRAPLGAIVLKAQDLTLVAGSVTSTSANGVAIPFGTLQVGADWTYQLPLGQTELFTGAGPPAQRLELNAQNIVVAPGATIDLSGGGDLLGYEFIPGVSGTKDVLGNAFVDGQFAIVPTLGLEFAPFDPATQMGFGYQVGDTVHLAGYGGLRGGEYAVLPARYALLPGAYLVRPVAGYTDILPDEAVQRLDGSVVISGSRGVAGTTISDSRTSGFAIYSGDVIKGQARYDLTLANDFFATRAETEKVAPPRLPRDAGQLQLISTSRLDLEGVLTAALGSGGRGARVDVSASRLRVVADGERSSDPTEVTIRASQLDALGAESVLLGGLRQAVETGTQIDTTADQLIVDGAVTIRAPTLTLVARNSLEIESGATLQASGEASGASSALLLSGDGALVRVSAADQVELARTGATGVGGRLVIDAGARISSGGSALIEATGAVDAKATFDLAGGSLAFNVARLGFGDADSTYAGVALSAKDLSSLNLRELSLTSASDIDFFRTAPVAATDDGSTTLRVSGTLALSAQSLNVHDAPTATIGADHLVLSGKTGATSVAGNGKLVLDAGDLVWGGGALAATGVNAVTISATNQLRAEQTGSLSAAADVRVATPEIVTGNGSDFAIRASGALDVLGTGQGPSSAAAPGTGGSLWLEGSRVTIGTKVRLPSGLVSLQADAADAAGAASVALTSDAAIDVGGFKLVFDGQVASGDGGLVRMTSQLGGIALAAGSVVDVSAGTGEGNAGRLDLRAPSGAITLTGTLLGNGAAGASGEIAVDGYSIPELGSLNRQLNTAGFDGSRVFHQRGPGDLVVPSGVDSVIRALNVDITADGGAVAVVGGIDASGPTGGTVKLAARGNVDISGFVKADSTTVREEGGRVELWTDAGGISVRDGASVSVAGGANGAGGLVAMRAPRQNLLSVLDADPSNDQVVLAGQISGNRELSIEGYQRYQVANGTIDATYTGAVASNPVYADASAFMQSADQLAAALKNGAAPTVVTPGIELDAAQGLTLAADWNLAPWRFNGQPGTLTLRAGGDLLIQKSLSDGFAAISGTGAFEIADVALRSWSYRLVAGADLNSGDVLAVKTAGTNAGSGKLTVAAGRVSTSTAAPVPVMVRTGTGSIEIATAADLVLANRASIIYTAGANSGAGVALPVLGLGLRNYPTDGGDISVSVGGNIVGAPTNQLVTGWLYRAGRDTALFPSATGWNVNFQRFEQGIGALAGGNVTVRADGNIRDLGASVASIGRQMGGTTAAKSVVEEIGGGNLVIESGGDITGGSYFDGKGNARIRSWGGIGINTAPGASALAPTLALGDTVMDVVTRRQLTLEAVVNPFLLPQATAQGGGPGAVSFFSSYSPRSAVHMVSTGGDTTLINSPNRPGGLLSTLGSSLALGRGIAGFSDYPGTLDVVSLAGDMSLSGAVVLWPSPIGDLRLLVNGDLNLAPSLTLPDVDPTTALPTIASPAGDLLSLGTLVTPPVAGVAHVPIHSAAFRSDGRDDPEPARIVATGDIISAAFAEVAKPLRLISGGDILDLQARIENLSDASVSLISAQGSIRYRTPRQPVFGYIVDNTIGIQIEGPGQLALEAGGSIDLGSSLGVTSAGNVLNPALPANGTDVSLLAGVTASGAELDAFENHYLVQGSLYDDQLSEFVQRYGGPAGAGKDAELAALRDMSADYRYQLAQSILFQEVRAGGRTAAGAGPDHGDYTRAFTAIDTLFPGSTSSSETRSLYPGDISLFFSRVYTLAGGNISFVAPGGEVNVGLATPPAAFGVTKTASSLGIVAQQKGDVASVSYGDFQVNESRVFAADGGDILVWSTQGDIDAGRGAKTAIAAPPPTITFNAAGNPVAIFPAALTGSGIQALSTSEGTRAGAVDLFAPRGVVNASDAGIVAGDITIGATAVLGADNISVSGVAVGVPVDTGGFASALTGVSAVAASAANTAEQAVTPSRQQAESETPLAAQALGFLDVFITGFGEECDSKKEDCSKGKQN